MKIIITKKDDKEEEGEEKKRKREEKRTESTLKTRQLIFVSIFCLLKISNAIFEIESE